MTNNPYTSDVPTFESVEWESTLSRLLVFSKRMHGRHLSHIKDAPTPEDLAQETVTDFLTGVRTIPPHIPLLSGLCAILASKVSHIPTHSHVSRRVAIEQLDELAERLYYSAAMIEYVDLRELILAELMNDAELSDVVLLLWEDPDLKPRDVAEMLEKPVQEIYNLYRRLRYKLKGIKASIQKAD